MVELHSLAEAYNYIKRDKYLVTDQAWQETMDTYPDGHISQHADGSYWRKDGEDWTQITAEEAAEQEELPKENEQQKINRWLDFEYITKEIKMNDGSIVEVPMELTRDPYNQKPEDVNYKITTKELKQQIEYLQNFDFKNKSMEDVSNSMRLMGKVNACAIKGNRQSMYFDNFIVYQETKDKYLPKLADYCVENNIPIYHTGTELLIENPVTGVQISFHTPANKAKNYFHLGLKKRIKWDGITHSYIYKNKEQRDKYQKIVNSSKQLYNVKYSIENGGK